MYLCVHDPNTIQHHIHTKTKCSLTCPLSATHFHMQPKPHTSKRNACDERVSTEELHTRACRSLWHSFVLLHEGSQSAWRNCTLEPQHLQHTHTPIKTHWHMIVHVQRTSWAVCQCLQHGMLVVRRQQECLAELHVGAATPATYPHTNQNTLAHDCTCTTFLLGSVSVSAAWYVDGT